MNSTYLHLLLNHFPIIGSLLGSGMLLWGIIKKQQQIQAAGAVILILMAIIAIPVFLTGEPAEETIENLPGVSESMMELHEDSATLALWIMGFTGIASLIALWMQWTKKSQMGKSFIIVFLLSVLSFGSMVRTGYYGGRIRHSEIRDANAITNSENDSENKTGTTTEGKEKDDDD